MSAMHSLPDAVMDAAITAFTFHDSATVGERAVLRRTLYEAIAVAIADAEARGRAAALAEVDAAAERLALASRAQGFIGAGDGSARTFALFIRHAVTSGVPPCAPWTIDGRDGDGDTFSSAVLAAAALAGGDE